MAFEHDTLVAERKDDTGSLVATPGQSARLQVDANGYLKVTTSGGVGSTTFNAAALQLVSDVNAQWQQQEMLLTLRAILNHLRALTTGSNVDETAPIQGAR